MKLCGFQNYALALYFHDKSISGWCADLGIPEISDLADWRKLGG
jgi:hypothetical protein